MEVGFLASKRRQIRDLKKQLLENNSKPLKKMCQTICDPKSQTAPACKTQQSTHLNVLLKECIFPPSRDMSSWELLVVEPAAKDFAMGFFTYGGSYFGSVLFFLVQAWRWNAHSDQSLRLQIG